MDGRSDLFRRGCGQQHAAERRGETGSNQQPDADRAGRLEQHKRRDGAPRSAERHPDPDFPGALLDEI